jgi:hypothetical protein
MGKKGTICGPNNSKHDQIYNQIESNHLIIINKSLMIKSNQIKQNTIGTE